MSLINAAATFSLGAISWRIILITDAHNLRAGRARIVFPPVMQLCCETNLINSRESAGE